MTNELFSDRYEIQGMIGKGGMATVYHAVDLRFDRDVAIKVLPREFLHDHTFIDRFSREARTIAGLGHAAIVPIYDYGEQNGQPFMVMAYMPGGSLRDKLRNGLLPLDQAQTTLTRVGEALDAAHSKGIIHRDVKPANILYDSYDYAFLSDFGIVKLSESTAQLTGSGIVGTPAYMAPEMMDRGGLTHLIDVYALAVTLYQTLTGRQPFDADTPLGLLMAHANKPVPDLNQIRPDLPDTLQAVIEQGMAKDPTARYQSASALSAAFRGALQGDIQLAVPPPTAPEPVAAQATLDAPTMDIVSSPASFTAPPAPAPQAKRRSPLLWMSIIGVVLVIGIIGLIMFLSRGGSTPPAAAESSPTTRPTATKEPASEGEPAAAVEELSPESACPDWDLMTPELVAACNGEYSGTTVTIIGNVTGVDEAKFNEAIKDFEAWTGIDIQYTGTGEFETIISTDIEAGNPPDIADFPQPGLLRNFVGEGYVVDVSTFLNEEWMTRNYKQAWLDMAQMDGIEAGVWARYNGKSQVWYPKKAWDEAGYPIPENWGDLLALSDQIVADGSTPWCIGLESGPATGWPATDWIEETMLRTTSLENYDNWSFPADPANRLPFTSPEVKNAAETMAQIWFNDDYVYGGTANTANIYFGDAANPMFENPPQCWLHKQGNFITGFFPEGARSGVDYDFFYLPPIDEQYGKPYLVAGDIYAMFNDRPEVRATMDFFTRGESLKGWMARGGALSPHNDASLDWYGDDIERGIAQLVNEADSVRFDGSDLMPGVVGAGSFWTGMTSWVKGEIDLDTALAQIDASWPN